MLGSQWWEQRKDWSVPGEMYPMWVNHYGIAKEKNCRFCVFMYYLCTMQPQPASNLLCFEAGLELIGLYLPLLPECWLEAVGLLCVTDSIQMRQDLTGGSCKKTDLDSALKRCSFFLFFFFINLSFTYLFICSCELHFLCFFRQGLVEPGLASNSLCSRI